MEKKIHLKIENALNLLLKLDKPFDLIFIDADKKNYIHYYNTILSKNLLKEDGLMVIDNVLFKGLVTQFNENKKENGKEEQSSHLISIAKLIHEFNQYIAQDQRTEKVLLTIRDGLTLLKLKNHPNNL